MVSSSDGCTRLPAEKYCLLSSTTAQAFRKPWLLHSGSPEQTTKSLYCCESARAAKSSSDCYAGSKVYMALQGP